MKIEIILIVTIGLVLLVDFIVKGVRSKKNKKTIEDKLIEPKDKKNKHKISTTLLLIFFGLSTGFLIEWYLGGSLKHYFTTNIDYLDYIPVLSNFSFGLIPFLVIDIILRFGVINLNYIKERKKNIILFTLIVTFLKPTVHFMLYPKYRMIRNIDFRRNKEVKLNFGEHLDLMFTEELELFIPCILIPLFLVWYFNDRIKAR